MMTMIFDRLSNFWEGSLSCFLSRFGKAREGTVLGEGDIEERKGRVKGEEEEEEGVS